MMKTGQCHKYKEYDIKPIEVRISLDKTLIKILFLYEKKIIIHVPITGSKLIIEGKYILSLKRIKEKMINANPTIIKNDFVIFLKFVSNFFFSNKTNIVPDKNSHALVGSE